MINTLKFNLLSIAERLSQQCGTLYHRVRMFEPPVADN